jgi:peptide/nickel transport system ATP-binding protein
LLEVRGLAVEFPTEDGVVRAVDGIDLALPPGARLGLVGESGSGKSTTALALMRMIAPPGRIVGGSAVLAGRDLLALDAAAMRAARLRDIAYIPQGAMSSLNPVLSVGAQLADAIRAHEDAAPAAEIERRVRAALAGVDLPEQVARLYPHELSGGMKQRACIAIGLILGPRLVIADEPTSALDVVTQRQVMETLGRAQRALGSGLILIGHDMGLMAQFVDLLGVMYAGRLVEFGPIERLFKAAQHPYTRALIAAVPTLDNRGRLAGIPGVTPSLRALPPGCAFAPRCASAFAPCRVQRPAYRQLGAPGGVACHLSDPEHASAA